MRALEMYRGRCGIRIMKSVADLPHWNAVLHYLAIGPTMPTKIS